MRFFVRLASMRLSCFFSFKHTCPLSCLLAFIPAERGYPNAATVEVVCKLGAWQPKSWRLFGMLIS